MTPRFIVPAAALSLGVLLGGCSAADDAPPEACAEIIAHVSYEAMRGLAASGAATDPQALREAIPGHVADDSDRVELPPYTDFLELFDDGEQAQILSALSSSMVGVGGSFDRDAFVADTDDSGPCEGWTR